MILLFPGFWTRAQDYESFLQPLRAEGIAYQVVDLFSPGSSWPAPAELSLWRGAMRERIASLQPSLLVAYSLGGRLLLEMDADVPSIFFSTHPGLTSDREREMRQAQDDAWAEDFLSQDWQTLQDRWNGQDVFRQSTPLSREEKDYDRQKLADALQHFSLAKIPGASGNQKNPKALAWVVGEKDAKFRRLGQELQEKNPAFPLMTIPGAGHRLFWDAPEACRAILRRGLSAGTPKI